MKKEKKQKINLNFKTPPLAMENDKLFNTTEEWGLTAKPDDIFDRWSTYAIGYKKAADIVVARIEVELKHKEILVYPIMFLYRQYLELSLKNLILKGRKLQGIKDSIPLTHNICKLWETCEKLISNISPNDSTEEIKQIGRLIKEFQDVDQTSTGFRYPEETKGNPSLSNVEYINLKNVRDVIGKIKVIVYGLDCQFSEYLACEFDMEDL